MAPDLENDDCRLPRWSQLTRMWIRARNRALGLERYADAMSYFGPGGLEEAVAECEVANRDLLAYVRPPEAVHTDAIRRDFTERRGDGVLEEHYSFDSPLPSGDAENDRVRLRLFRPPGNVVHDRAILFHHAVYGRRWSLWTRFLEPLMRRVPVALMAAPYHYERRGAGRFPGEGMLNANPARVFQGIRQWCWDHQASVDVLERMAKLRVTAEIGYSLGAFQSTLLSAAGRIHVPLVSLASTNRYAWGVTNGVIGHGLLGVTSRAGIDRARLAELTDSLQLERYAPMLRGRPVLYVRGARDFVDPPPSLERLQAALQPMRAIVLPVGHAGVVLFRARVMREVLRFFGEVGALERAAVPDMSQHAQQG
ncbi:MAG: hypothetical protein GY716_25770 [bacterium]|nr:hypothetical protein [bacterium]